MPYTLPADVDERPVIVDGAGTLGRQIVSVYAAGREVAPGTGRGSFTAEWTNAIVERTERLDGTESAIPTPGPPHG